MASCTLMQSRRRQRAVGAPEATYSCRRSRPRQSAALSIEHLHALIEHADNILKSLLDLGHVRALRRWRCLLRRRRLLRGRLLGWRLLGRRFLGDRLLRRRRLLGRRRRGLLGGSVGSRVEDGLLSLHATLALLTLSERRRRRRLADLGNGLLGGPACHEIRSRAQFLAVTRARACG